LVLAAVLGLVALAVAALIVLPGDSNDRATQEQAFIAAVRADDEFTVDLTDDEVLADGRLNCEQAEAGTLDQTFEAITQASTDLGEDPGRVGRRVVLAITMLCPQYEDELPAPARRGTSGSDETTVTTLPPQSSRPTTSVATADNTPRSTLPPPVPGSPLGDTSLMGLGYPPPSDLVALVQAHLGPEVAAPMCDGTAQEFCLDVLEASEEGGVVGLAWEMEYDTLYLLQPVDGYWRVVEEANLAPVGSDQAEPDLPPWASEALG
jgi:hypothetical protein